ncbi:hypothetical protein FXF51_54575 [Nonomuraea sp. PA05]|uniref:hypothetical protein n=1 Tax=Nonomuraea sp. PA05 TaxID=2604466 RepID=UPI0011D576B8|nr:hypothetical protein [Nonomuraea sp. PA05]TYB50914.1 hypothetical protein FXF51_54575 [Nonomuraea sp. PA05]
MSTDLAAGPVLLGASFEETGRVLAAWGAPYPGAEPLDWRLLGSGVDVHAFCGSAGVVQTVEIYRDLDVELRAHVFLLGVDLFSTPAEQVIAELRARFDVEVDQGDCGLVVPELSRSGVPYPGADQETVDRYTCFESVLIASRGYYDPPPGTEHHEHAGTRQINREVTRGCCRSRRSLPWWS